MSEQERRKTKTENFTLRLEPARKAALRRLAETRGLSPSELVRELVIAVLTKREHDR